MSKTQDKWFYNGKWTPDVECKFVKVLAEEAHAGNIPEGHLNEASIRRAMNAVNNAYNTCLDYRYCATKFMKLKQRFDVFKWMISLTDIAYDPSENWVGCDERVWESIVRRGPKIVDAFKEKGEPMFAAMKVIFEGSAENIEPDDE